MKFKKICNVTLAAALACTRVASPVLAAPDVDELQEQKEQVESEVSSLQGELNSLITKLNDLEWQLIEKGEEIIEAEGQLKAAEEKEKQQYKDMKLRIKYFYESGDTSAVEMFMEAGSISEMLSKAEYAQKMQEYDRNMLKSYGETVQEVKDLKSSLEKEQSELLTLQGEFKAEQETVAATIDSKSAEISDLDEMIQEAARKAEEERLAAEEAARRAAEEAAAQQNNNGGGGGSYGGGGGASAPSYNEVTGNVVVDRAYGCLGLPYVWGATGPSSFDCSGLVGYALTGGYGRVGTTWTFLTWPQVSDPQPGDVCTNSGHCGIYIGGGQMIHAADYGIGVIVGPVQAGMIYVRYPY